MFVQWWCTERFFFFMYLPAGVPAQRSEREWPIEASAGKAKVGLRAPRWCDRLYMGRLCLFCDRLS